MNKYTLYIHVITDNGQSLDYETEPLTESESDRVLTAATNGKVVRFFSPTKILEGHRRVYIDFGKVTVSEITVVEFLIN